MGKQKYPFIHGKLGTDLKYQDKRKTNLQGPALESGKHGVVFETGALVFHHPMNNEVH